MTGYYVPRAKLSQRTVSEYIHELSGDRMGSQEGWEGDGAWGSWIAGGEERGSARGSFFGIQIESGGMGWLGTAHNTDPHGKP